MNATTCKNLREAKLHTLNDDAATPAMALPLLIHKACMVYPISAGRDMLLVSDVFRHRGSKCTNNKNTKNKKEYAVRPSFH